MSRIYFTLLIITVTFFSCNKKEDSQSSKTLDHSIYSFVKDFKLKNPTWENNNATREQINILFKKELYSFVNINKGCLDRTEFWFHSIEPSKINKGKFIAYFTNESLTKENRFDFDLVAEIDNKLVSSLTEGGRYYLKINDLELLSNSDANKYITPSYAIGSNEHHLYLGVFHCFVSSTIDK